MQNIRIGLYGLLALLCLGSLSQAQTQSYGPAQSYGPGIPAAPTAPPPKPILGYTAPAVPPDTAKMGFLQRLCHRCSNIGCQAHHNDFGCGSWKSDAVFIFGSCRAFWGDPCFKAPPKAYENWPGIFKP